MFVCRNNQNIPACDGYFFHEESAGGLRTSHRVNPTIKTHEMFGKTVEIRHCPATVSAMLCVWCF
jgi:hypothetical protein